MLRTVIGGVSRQRLGMHPALCMGSRPVLRGIGVVSRRCRPQPRLLHRRPLATMATPNNQAAETFTSPTPRQLAYHFTACAVPMIGFGFMDNTIMIQCGNYIDCTIGVMFGFSTLTAAAIGQVCSSIGAVLFGGTLEQMAHKAGLPNPGFTSAQRALPIVRRVGLAGSLVGVVSGCTLGLLNLYFIDTEKSSTLKLQAMTEEQEFAFEVEASNVARPDATTLTVRGPDMDGLLASMTAALTSAGCSLVELHASPRPNQNDISTLVNGRPTIEDTFVVTKSDTKRPVLNEDLDALARTLLEASKDPLSAHSLKAQVLELEDTNCALLDRLGKLEKVLEEKQITLAPSRMGAKD